MKKSVQDLPPVRYRDAEGNIYGVEQSAKTGCWITIRTNAGGNRKIAKMIEAVGNRQRAQMRLNHEASERNWAVIS